MSALVASSLATAGAAVATAGAAVATAGAALLGAATALTARRRLGLVALAAHELRGPATVILLAVERMEREPRTRGEARVLRVELERLRAGLADLDAARRGRRPERRRVELDPEPLARGAVAGWRPWLGGRGRRAIVDWRPRDARVVADPGRMAQILGNLAANAAQHGDGPVRLRGTRAGAAVRIEVTNEVPGADPGFRSARADAQAGEPAGAAARSAGAASGREPVPPSGRGLRVAERAARESGGSLRVERADGSVRATLELPAADGASVAPRR